MRFWEKFWKEVMEKLRSTEILSKIPNNSRNFPKKKHRKELFKKILENQVKTNNYLNSFLNNWIEKRIPGSRKPSITFFTEFPGFLRLSFEISLWSFDGFNPEFLHIFSGNFHGISSKKSSTWRIKLAISLRICPRVPPGISFGVRFGMLDLLYFKKDIWEIFLEEFRINYRIQKKTMKKLENEMQR